MTKINDKEVNKIIIPVTANITGTFTNPKVSTDLTSSVTNLTKQLVEIQKQKLMNQGKSEINKLLGDFTGITAPTVTDSTSTQTNPVKKDSTTATKPTSEVEKSVKGILGGLLKNKKKKDSVN